LGSVPVTQSSVEGFIASAESRTVHTHSSLHRAALGGAMADRLGFAFAFAYGCAVRSLANTERRAALAVTEAAGNGPAAIAATIRPQGGHHTISGLKSFVTLAHHVEEVYVAVSSGWEGPKNRVRLVRLEPRSAGMVLTELPTTPFAPELTHASMSMEGVKVYDDAILPGDGWVDYVRPFRTMEDAHVGAATTGMLLASGHLARTAIPRAVSTLAAFLAVGAEVKSPSTHLLLEGALVQLRQIMGELRADESPWYQRWTRDAALLDIGRALRERRLERAFQRMERSE